MAKQQQTSSGKPIPKYPRHTLDKALRIPKGILDQNAGKEGTDEESAQFIGKKYNKGEYLVELNSAIKYGLLNRPSEGRVALSDTAKKILRPQEPEEQLKGYREAALKAPDISAVYSHYRGEYLPDAQFFDNALQDKFGIPAEKLSDFKEIFFDTLKKANLLEEHDGKYKVLDVTSEVPSEVPGEQLKKLEKTSTVVEGDSCFVMMPFAAPLGTYYEKIYKPAIEKAGLLPVRADSEIFGTGKVMDQIWRGVKAARVLVAEMTSRNP